MSNTFFLGDKNFCRGLRPPGYGPGCLTVSFTKLEVSSQFLLPNGKSSAIFRAVLQRNLLICQVTQGASGCTSACPWLWSEGTVPVYWPVCKFDLIFCHPQCINQCCCPSLATLQWTTIACDCFALSVSPPVQYCFAPFSSYPDHRIAYDENTALWHISLHSKLLRPSPNRMRKKIILMVLVTT